MTKRKIKSRIKEAAEKFKIANVYTKFDAFSYSLIPLNSNEKLFLSIHEDDFIFDGYEIYRIKDIKKVNIKNNMCDEILEREGLKSDNIIPNIDITNWRTVFESLKLEGHNIIVEAQRKDENDSEFFIGRIGEIHNRFVYFQHFDANGIWDESFTKIPYSRVTNITFASRYVTIFSKYLSEPPDC